MNPVKIENLSFSYGKTPVINNVSLEIQAGTLTSILGPNGSGKTTLLKLILGLFLPSAGKILICGRDLSEIPLKERARLMAYVPQRHQAMFAYKVRDVVAMGRLPFSGIFCRITDSDYDIAAEYMKQLNIDHLADRAYTEISGGEQQLALVARALVQKAEILILDEPVAGLDYGNQLLLLEQLRKLSRSGITCLKTTHYPEHALWTSDNAIFLRDGQVLASGKADEIINSEMLYRLYGAKIIVTETNTGAHLMRTCVPDFTSRGS